MSTQQQAQSHEALITVLASFVVYVLVSVFNYWIFRSLEYSKAVSWIHLPSGMRVLIVLLAGGWGAVGIAFASMLFSWAVPFADVPSTAIAVGAVTGLAPYLAYRLCHKLLGLDLSLNNLTAGGLLAISVVFALLAACLHQVVLVWNGQEGSVLVHIAIMAFGNLTGTVIVLYVGKSIISKIGPKFS